MPIKTPTRKFCLLAVLLLFCLKGISLRAQEMCDSITLHSGELIAGKVTAWIPGKAVKIKTNDTEYVFRFCDIAQHSLHSLDNNSESFIWRQEAPKESDDRPYTTETVETGPPVTLPTALPSRYDRHIMRENIKTTIAKKHRDDFMRRQWRWIIEYTSGLTYADISFTAAQRASKHITLGASLCVRIGENDSYLYKGMYLINFPVFFDLRYTRPLGMNGLVSIALREGVTNYRFTSQTSCSFGGRIGAGYLLGGFKAEYQLSDGLTPYGIDLPNNQTLLLGASISLLY